MSYAIKNGKLVKSGAPLSASRPVQTNRTWATGSISIVANDSDCFTWQGTYRDAIELQKRWLAECDQIYALSAQSVAKRAAGYGMAYGMPGPGDVDMRPSHAGEKWSLAEVEVFKRAVCGSPHASTSPTPGPSLRTYLSESKSWCGLRATATRFSHRRGWKPEQIPTWTTATR